MAVFARGAQLLIALGMTLGCAERPVAVSEPRPAGQPAREGARAGADRREVTLSPRYLIYGASYSPTLQVQVDAPAEYASEGSGFLRHPDGGFVKLRPFATTTRADSPPAPAFPSEGEFERGRGETGYWWTGLAPHSGRESEEQYVYAAVVPSWKWETRFVISGDRAGWIRLRCTAAHPAGQSPRSQAAKLLGICRSLRVLQAEAR